MADYEVRKWRGWHHHMALVALAMLFILKERVEHEESAPLLSGTGYSGTAHVLTFPGGDARRKKSFQDLVRGINNTGPRQKGQRTESAKKTIKIVTK